jgi:hypothetical protein
MTPTLASRLSDLGWIPARGAASPVVSSGNFLYECRIGNPKRIFNESVSHSGNEDESVRNVSALEGNSGSEGMAL